eukprot:s2532_g21.t1
MFRCVELWLEGPQLQQKDRERAMASHVACWLLSMITDSQIARNSVFPESMDSPIIAMTAMALGCALVEWIMVENSPAGVRLQQLARFSTDFGRLIPEVAASLAEGDTEWIHRDCRYTMSLVQTELTEIRDTLSNSLEEMLQWRLALDSRSGSRFDRMTYAVILCSEELLYFDTLPPVRTIREGFGSLQTRIQQEIANREAREFEMDPHGMEARWPSQLAILAAAEQSSRVTAPEDEVSSRSDLPSRVPGKRANLQAALEAAKPNQRQRALQSLEQDILARSTSPAYQARLRTYLAICRAWEAPAFPLDHNNTKCFAASLKAGGYRSAAIYFQAVSSYQQRTLKTPVPPMVKIGIRDFLRSILRGLGTAKLKDAFDAFLLNTIQPSTDYSEFSFGRTDHVRDMVVLGLWYMMREAEMAAARSGDLRLDGQQVSMTIPLHKTDSRGSYTQRVLSCSCGARTHHLCAWHSAERHLLRLEAHSQRANSMNFPLFPMASGQTASKQVFIEAIRSVIAQTGTPLTRAGPDGVESHRFFGHVLRISGAQMLSSSGVELSLIQLLGRWTSTAVLRYTQESALVRVPQIPRQVLQPEEEQPHRVQLVAAPPTPAAAVAAAAPAASNRAARPKSFASAIRGLQTEMEKVKLAITSPEQTFVFRPKAKILHKASPYEDHNEPSKWRTPCGWSYGCRTFLRTSSEHDGSRRCKKCFDLSDKSSSSSEDSSESFDLAASSDSSSDED